MFERAVWCWNHPTFYVEGFAIVLLRRYIQGKGALGNVSTPPTTPAGGGTETACMSVRTVSRRKIAVPIAMTQLRRSNTYDIGCIATSNGFTGVPTVGVRRHSSINSSLVIQPLFPRGAGVRPNPRAMGSGVVRVTVDRDWERLNTLNKVHHPKPSLAGYLLKKLLAHNVNVCVPSTALPRLY